MMILTTISFNSTQEVFSENISVLCGLAELFLNSEKANDKQLSTQIINSIKPAILHLKDEVGLWHKVTLCHSLKLGVDFNVARILEDT